MDQNDYRKEIDRIDRELIDAFVRRMKVCGEIGLYKEAKGLPLYDQARELAKVTDAVSQVPEDLREYVSRLYSTLFELSKSYQKRLIRAESQSEEDSRGRVTVEDTRNIVLIGMPGAGKTTVSGLLGPVLGREVLGTDQLFEEAAGMSIPAFFASHSEEEFRKEETRILSEIGEYRGKIIATGGGCVLRPENEAILRKNGRIFWLQRDPERLSSLGRPLSIGRDLHEMLRVRAPLYARFSDDVIDNNGTLKETVQAILDHLKVQA